MNPHDPFVPFVITQQLSKRYGSTDMFATTTRWALDHVDLSVDVGQVVALVGESGSGKTTLGRCMLGLTEPTSGTVRIGPHLVTSRMSRAQHLAFCRQAQMIFQNPAGCLNPRLSILTSLSEPLDIHRLVPHNERRARCQQLLRWVDLEADLLDRYPHQISGGQRQRVVIARALATEPSFLVADEPTSALDVSQQNEIADLLLSLKNRLGLALLVITHEMALVQRMTDQVFVLFAGRIIESGPTAAVFSAPLHPYTQTLLRSSRVFTTRPSGVEKPVGVPLESPNQDQQHWDGQCAYLSRCSMAVPECRLSAPTLKQRNDSQQYVACFVAENVAAADSVI